MNKTGFAVLVPVRGGSKGIARKNIKHFCGKPLVYWVLKAASDVEMVDKIYVSTDDDQIKEVVDGFCFSKVVVIGRSEATAQDESSTESVMLEFAENHEFENIILIQATSPLLESGDLERGIEIFLNDQSDSLLSVVRQKRFLWKEDGPFCVPSNYDPQSRPRRQDFEGFLVENGAFYITSRQALLQTKCRLSGRVSVCEMSEDSYFEIDELSDWNIAEGLKKKRMYKGISEIDFSKIKLLICDVDGVLTDGGMYYSDEGEIMKKFNTRDGKGIELLRTIGVKTMFLTGENAEAVRKRAEKLKVDYLHMGIVDKVEFLRGFFVENGDFSFDNIAYIGDDLNDLESLKLAYLSAAPADGNEEVKKNVRYVCFANGGDGCVRELCDLILSKTNE